MTKYLTPGVITGVLTAAAAVASFMGQDTLAAFFGDPTTAANVTQAVTAIGAIIAGFLSGVKPSV